MELIWHRNSATLATVLCIDCLSKTEILKQFKLGLFSRRLISLLIEFGFVALLELIKYPDRNLVIELLKNSILRRKKC